MRRLISSNAQVFERLANIEYELLEHDKKFDVVFNELQKDKNFKQKIFFEGQIYNSYSLIIDIIKRRYKAMPSWEMHLSIANRICEKGILDSNQFIFANIMPDIFEGHHIKEISKKIQKYSTHYPMKANINGVNILIPDIQEFKEEYKKNFANPIVLGYFCHLVTDYFWNSYVYKKYFDRPDDIGDFVKIRLKDGQEKILEFDDAVKIKQEDFRIFAQYIRNNSKMKFPIYQDEILNNSRDIKEFHFTQPDIRKALEYIDKNMKENCSSETIEEKYKMFTVEELMSKMDECIEFVKESIEIYKL